ncbi:hypothetical protein CRT60_22210 [Azospirillum palustre]|uniref:Uncharacterized protein n=1 Tax=Azospirillum palustre TaxID=2044885 RepID=A0A2B8B3V6_9PROT|nr:hypothetical protein CRT60_22210 [Azospirillum palustre]
MPVRNFPVCSVSVCALIAIIRLQHIQVARQADLDDADPRRHYCRPRHARIETWLPLAVIQPLPQDPAGNVETALSFAGHCAAGRFSMLMEGAVS